MTSEPGQVPLGVHLGSRTITESLAGYRRRAPEPEWPAPLTVRVDWSRFNHAARETLHLHVVEGPDGMSAALRYHSLTITRIAARMRRRLRADVPLQVFYDTPTGGAVVAAAMRGDR